MMNWRLVHPQMTPDMLGFLPSFLSDLDPRPAREQINENYAHGGGWSPFEGFKISGDSIIYPGDPPNALLAETQLRDEVIRFYEHEWLMILQPDGSFEISRID